MAHCNEPGPINCAYAGQPDLLRTGVYLGAGARLALTALHALEARGGKRALATMCVGVGQGVSLALERV